VRKISEYKIEQYLRFPEELLPQERQKIKAYVEGTEEGKAIAEWLTAFFEEFDNLTTLKPAVIQLTNRKFKSRKKGPFVLAAMSAQKTTEGLQTKATLASEEGKTLLRVLEDRRSKKMELHVLSTHMHKEDRVIITCQNPPLELVTQKYGKLKHLENLSQINWEDASVQLRLPVQRTNLSSACLQGGVVKAEAGEAKIKMESDGELLYLHNTAGTGLSKVLLEQGETSRLANFEEGCAILSCDTGSDCLLYFYK